MGRRKGQEGTNQIEHLNSGAVVLELRARDDAEGVKLMGESYLADHKLSTYRSRHKRSGREHASGRSS
jgi:hypothetical protein